MKRLAHVSMLSLCLWSLTGCDRPNGEESAPTDAAPAATESVRPQMKQDPEPGGPSGGGAPDEPDKPDKPDKPGPSDRPDLTPSSEMVANHRRLTDDAIGVVMSAPIDASAKQDAIRGLEAKHEKCKTNYHFCTP